MLNILIAIAHLVVNMVADHSKTVAPANASFVNSAPALEVLPFANGSNVQDYLPAGYVRNGSVDYTDYIQLAINRNDKIIFPAFPLLVNDKGLKIGSNKSIVFLKGSEIRLKSSAKIKYAILDITEVSNVSLYNPVIIGDRYSHRGDKGEWGMGISIKGSRDIKVFGSRITNCWGDGIYLGQGPINKVNKDILISKAFLSKNRRDGISIISVDGLILEDVFASHQDGTKPMCGINFETNNPRCEIKNVKVINPRTEFNRGSGIQISIGTMLGGGNKEIDVKITNHIDVGSKSFAMKLSCNRKSGTYGGSVEGLVSIVNPSWNKTIGDRPLAFITDEKDLKMTVSSPKIQKSNGASLNSNEMRAVMNKHSNGNLKIF